MFYDVVILIEEILVEFLSSRRGGQNGRYPDILSRVIIPSLGSIKMITKRKVKFW